MLKEKAIQHLLENLYKVRESEQLNIRESSSKRKKSVGKPLQDPRIRKT